jgi:peptidoglycan/LPS O-acetylase OafA/YrhL
MHEGLAARCAFSFRKRLAETNGGVSFPQGRNAFPARHLDFVDGLRAVAVLSVVVFHTLLHLPMPATPWNRASIQGCHGVDLFFVVSGFCLAYPMLARLRRGEPFRFNYSAFFAKRLTRIYPAYFVALAACCVLATTPQWHALALDTPPQVPAEVYTWLGTLREFFLLDKPPLHSGSFWTLGIELRWYLIFPFALWLFVRSPLGLILAGGASWLLAYESSIQSLDLVLLPGFFMGILAAHLYLQRPGWLRWVPYVTIFILGYELLYAPLNDPQSPESWGPLWELAAFGFVLSAFHLAPLRALLSWRPITVVGAASYSIYLVHEPVVAWLDFVRLSPLLTVLIAVVCGLGFWYAVERPLMQPQRRARMVARVAAALESLGRFLSRPERISSEAA